jgi:hypothetical protein
VSRDATLSANPGLATSLAHTFTLRDGGSQHPVGQRSAQPCGLGDVQEVVRQQRPEPGVTPAHERLETDHVSVEARDGLVVQQQLVGLDGVPQLGIDPGGR